MADTSEQEKTFYAILVSDSQDKLADLKDVIETAGIQYDFTPSGSGALRAARKRAPDFLFAYVDLPDSSGIKVIQTFKKRYPLTLCALVGPSVHISERRTYISEGADDYIEIDGNVSRLDASVGRLIARKQIGILGRNEKILQIIEIIEGIAPTKVTVLITGESGTGKELIARAIHERSPRHDKPFVAINCGAIPQGVLESELFGHEKGSFTGATSQRKGIFEIADGGTLLLDEIGEMPLGTQVKLLRVLEEEKFMRVGGSKDVKVDVRVIASTNRNLKQLVDEGLFRRDLFYRLNVVPIHVPPLRERREDISTLFFGLVAEACEKNNVEFGGITDEAIFALQSYDWPGNVRELRNLVESLVVLSKGKRIDLDDLPDHIVKREQVSRDLPVRVGRPRDEIERDLLFGRLAGIEKQIGMLTQAIIEVRDILLGRGKQPFEREIPHEADWIEVSDQRDIVVKPGSRIKDVERQLIEKTLKQVGGNRKKAAKLLGIGERTLYRRMKEYDLH